MANFPITGTNIDFGSLPEGLSALQRNPQIQRAIGAGAAVNFTGSVLYAVIPNILSVTVHDTTNSYIIGAPGMVFPFGAPLDVYQFNVPPGGAVTVTPASSNVTFTVLYK